MNTARATTNVDDLKLQVVEIEEKLMRETYSVHSMYLVGDLKYLCVSYFTNLKTVETTSTKQLEITEIWDIETGNEVLRFDPKFTSKANEKDIQILSRNHADGKDAFDRSVLLPAVRGYYGAEGKESMLYALHLFVDN